MDLKLPRTIRLDPSDTLVFERAAEPGEWAVSGSFLFWDTDMSTLSGKARAALRAGFVGVESLGFSTLVVISEAGPEEYDAAIESLALHLQDRLGAPSREAARAAAREEVEFAGGLCEYEINTILALHRTVERGEMREQFRVLRLGGRMPGAADRLHAQARAFEIIHTDEDEQADLLGLIGGRRP